MKQFKVNSKNAVYNVFADSEVEAVNKVKEVEAKVGDAIMVYSFETIKENGSKGSISVRASSEQEAKVEAEKLLKREVNTFGVKMKLGKLFNSYKVGDSKVNDAYDIKPGAIFKARNKLDREWDWFIKVVNIDKDGKVNFNEIHRYNTNNQSYTIGYGQRSVEDFKKYLSRQECRPVNSLYDSKIVDGSNPILNAYEAMRNKIMRRGGDADASVSYKGFTFDLELYTDASDRMWVDVWQGREKVYSGQISTTGAFEASGMKKIEEWIRRNTK